MNRSSSPLSEWLEKLQQESWNLELLISGFSIFLLFQSTDILLDGLRHLNYHTDLDDSVRLLVVSVLGTLYIGVSALIVNLIFHVFLRGIWIGAIGLRSVQQNIDYKKLNYSEFFTQKLAGRVRSLDNMIIQLDTICSVIFSFTFLVFFMLFSFVVYFVLMVVLIKTGQHIVSISSGTLETFLKRFFIFSLISYNLFGLLYFIDTLSTGFLKKYHWVSRIYYPFYRFFNF